MPEPDTTCECDECKSGVHKHMDNMNQSYYKDAPRHQKLDAIDCKNRTAFGQCVCHKWREEYHRMMCEGNTI